MKPDPDTTGRSLDRISMDPTKLSKEELVQEWNVREEELRLQNEQLRESELRAVTQLQRFETMFNHFPLPVVIVDDHLVIVDANRAAKETLPALIRVRDSSLVRFLDAPTRSSVTRALVQGGVADIDAGLHLQAPVSYRLRVVPLHSGLGRMNYAVIFQART
ncbi:PAS domain-containing protein [Rhodocista pekingensis]|uniref:PAS domain-containing protein n=1 Tax=Rhodocista pekingensis TaxID=201185 RepID=A0ABW2L0G6_9PROT